MTWPRILLVFAALLPTTPAPGQIHRFDMGTAESALRDGFTRVTAQSLYSSEAGFGWQSADGLREHDRHYSREWEYNESRGSTQPPPIYTNEITCDSIYDTRKNSFLLDLPAGDYRLWVLCGRSAGSAQDYHDFDLGVRGTVTTTTVKIPGPYRFERRELAVRHPGGQLALEIEPRTTWLLAALVVFPASEAKSVRSDWLDALEQEIDFLPPDEAAKWQKTEHVDDRPMPELSDADRERGYALFARHWSEVIYPNTVPRGEELKPELAAFATPGEYEPLTVTVHPLRDLQGAELVAGELRSDSAVIPAGNLEIRSLRNMLVRPNYSTYYHYHVAPDVLERHEPMDLKQGENQRFWITVRVPDDAAPGIYEGRLTFRAADAGTAEVPLRLRVLPFRLKKDPDLIYGMYYRDPLSSVDPRNTPEANAYFQRKAEWERQDMVAHGMNSHISSVSGLERDAQGNWTMNGEETERRIALSRRYGLADKPLVVSLPVSYWYGRLVDRRGTGSHLRLVGSDVPESFFDEVRKMVEAVEREKPKYRWPELLYYPIDEPSTSEASVQFMVGVLRAIKQLPGVRTYVTADPTHEQFGPMWPYVDVWCCQPFVWDHDTIRRLSREKNVEFWCYPNHISGENDHTPVRGARMTWGFGFWRSGFRTLIPWIYQSSSGDPWNYLDGSSMDFFNRSTPEGEPIPVTLWEAYREGIDDGRYVYTLQQAIARAKQRGGQAAERAAEAQRELAYVWDAIQVLEKYKHDDLWSGEAFDAYRWLLATQIMALQ
ncbi:MAG: hypothetical protein KJ000_31195 [Pirellulaceae bacterium]|nr:hypothetical protein [Pirellulaceae bacterium]